MASCPPKKRLSLYVPHQNFSVGISLFFKGKIVFLARSKNVTDTLCKNAFDDS
jgi:hypothetical protein